MVPETQSCPLEGRTPTAVLSRSQITTVNDSFGYGLSRLMNVGVPSDCAAVVLPATSPQTVAFSPMWFLASVEEIVCAATGMRATESRKAAAAYIRSSFIGASNAHQVYIRSVATPTHIRS